MARVAVALLIAALAPVWLEAQKPAAPAPIEKAATEASPAPAATTTPPPAESYTYAPDGRRDPFLTLVGTGSEANASSGHLEGVAGLMTAELSVRGVLQSRGALLAMVQGPDNKTHVVRAGDKLRDGTVKAVNTDGLLIIQTINDPLSLQKQREVRRLLRTLEDAKE
jgi:Tfp pilus assembly protein PilP